MEAEPLGPRRTVHPRAPRQRGHLQGWTVYQAMLRLPSAWGIGGGPWARLRPGSCRVLQCLQFTPSPKRPPAVPQAATALGVHPHSARWLLAAGSGAGHTPRWASSSFCSRGYLKLKDRAPGEWAFFSPPLQSRSSWRGPISGRPRSPSPDTPPHPLRRTPQLSPCLRHALASFGVT